MPRIETTRSAERGRATPTRRSRPTPRAERPAATADERRTRSPNVTVRRIVAKRDRGRIGGGRQVHQLVHQAIVRPRAPGRVPLDDRLVAFGRRRDGERAERPVGRRRQLMQDDAQRVEQAPGERGIEAAAVEVEFEQQLPAGHSDERQREVGLLVRVGALDRQAGHAVGDRGIDRVVLEDEQALEGLALPAEPAPAEDVDERRVLEIALPRETILERAQPRSDGRFVGQRHAHRQRVDEEADHPLGAVERGRPAGNGGAEERLTGAGERADHHRPRALDDRAEGQPALAGEGRERVGRLHGQVRRDVFERAGQPAARDVSRGGGQRRRRVEAGELGGPERARGLGRLRAHERDVIAERPARLERVRAAGAVEREQVLQEQRDAPAVENQMMMRPDELPAIRRQADERHAHERRAAEREAGGAIGGEERVETPGLRGLAVARPVVLAPRQLRLRGTRPGTDRRAAPTRSRS